MNNKLPGFWRWFFYGVGAGPGARRLFNRWMMVHATAGILLSRIVSASLEIVAEKALLPLMAIFVGLAFSWAGNAHALLQSDEIIKMAAQRRGGIFEYVHTFQLCILVMLVVIVCWVLPGLGLYYLVPRDLGIKQFNAVAECVLYALLSLALQTSWQAVLGANMLLLARAELKRPSADD